jgi:hypothetical protein
MTLQILARYTKAGWHFMLGLCTSLFNLSQTTCLLKDT